MDERIVPLLWVFGLFALFLVSHYLSSREKERKEERIHRERMLAMDKGIPLPELPPLPQEDLQHLSTINPKWTLGIGAVLAALGIGILAAMIISTTRIQPYWTLGLIPIFLGFGCVLYYYLTRPRTR
ncbi:MAG: hypothetical protein FJW20_04265 [Acidimicrobiia bacterium]|nr:hypothetical protein [Acidimicrobiia bacterium]